MADNTAEESRLKAWRKQLADRQNIERIVGAAVAIVATNLVKYLFSDDLATRLFTSVFDVPPSLYFDNNRRNFIIVVLLVLYGVVFYFLYKKFFGPLARKRRVIYGTLVLISVITVFVANVSLIPLKTEAKDLIKLKDWSDRIVATQAPGGGIRAKADDKSFPTQVWTTAQALTAMLANHQDLDASKIPAIREAFNYIENARHPNPNTPPGFDEGWGLFEQSRKSTTEIAGWVTLASISSLESKIRVWDTQQAETVRERVKRDLALIVQRQSNDGGWRPIKEDGPKFTRTYSTAIALWSLIEARRSNFVRQAIGNTYDSNISDGINWLLKNYTTIVVDDKPKKLGWVPNPNRSSQREQFDGLTAQVLFILSRIQDEPAFEYLKNDGQLLEYKRAFLTKQDLAARFVCSNDRIHDFDLSFTRDDGTLDFVLEGSTLLWFPWSYAALTALSKDTALTPAEQAQAGFLRKQILDLKVGDMKKFVHEEFIYVLAEHLYCFSVSE
jgi:hypothetical protein